MNDNELIILLRNTIIAQEAVADIAGLPIVQAFQPTQQGINSEPTAYIHKIGDKRYGFPMRSDVWDADAGIMRHTEVQLYETTFQISALATQDPASIIQYTASDILNIISNILQSSETIAILESAGVGILRVMDIRNPYFMDDRQRFEASPSFDFIVTHRRTLATNGKVLDSVELSVTPI